MRLHPDAHLFAMQISVSHFRSHKNCGCTGKFATTIICPPIIYLTQTSVDIGYGSESSCGCGGRRPLLGRPWLSHHLYFVASGHDEEPRRSVAAAAQFPARPLLFSKGHSSRPVRAQGTHTIDISNGDELSLMIHNFRAKCCAN